MLLEVKIHVREQDKALKDSFFFNILQSSKLHKSKKQIFESKVSNGGKGGGGCQKSAKNCHVFF